MSGLKTAAFSFRHNSIDAMIFSCDYSLGTVACSFHGDSRMRRNHSIPVFLALSLLAFLPSCVSMTGGIPVSGAAGIDTRPTQDPIGVSAEAYASAPTTMVRCGTFPVVVVWHQLKNAAVYAFMVDEDSQHPQLAFYIIIKKQEDRELVTYQYLHTGRPYDFVNVVGPHVNMEARRLAGAVLDLYLAPDADGDQALRACNDAIREMHAAYRARA